MPKKDRWWTMSPEELYAHANSLVEQGTFENWLTGFDDEDLAGCLTDEFTKGQQFRFRVMVLNGEQVVKGTIPGEDLAKVMQPWLYHTFTAPTLAASSILKAYKNHINQKLKGAFSTGITEMMHSGTAYAQEIAGDKFGNVHDLTGKRTNVDATVRDIVDACQNLKMISALSIRIIQARHTEDVERLGSFTEIDPQHELPQQQRVARTFYETHAKEIDQYAQNVINNSMKSLQIAFDDIKNKVDAINTDLEKQVAGQAGRSPQNNRVAQQARRGSFQFE